MTNRITNEYGAAQTPLAQAFSEIELAHDKAVRKFIEDNNLSPDEISILAGIFGNPTIFAECRLRAQMNMRRAGRPNA